MDLKERIKKATVPLRPDGHPDLGNWESYVNQIGFKNLKEMVEASRLNHGGIESVMIESALHHEKTVIATEFIDKLQKEGLTIREAIDFLNFVKAKILDLNLNP